MPETRTAKLFRNGASQAVRLPAEFRFDGKEVYATRDEATGDVVLSQRPGARSWSEFFAGTDSSPLDPRSRTSSTPTSVGTRRSCSTHCCGKA